MRRSSEVTDSRKSDGALLSTHVLHLMIEGSDQRNYFINLTCVLVAVRFSRHVHVQNDIAPCSCLFGLRGLHDRSEAAPAIIYLSNQPHYNQAELHQPRGRLR